MDTQLLLVAFLGFSAGYILRLLVSWMSTFSIMGVFVRLVAQDILKLMGVIVYQVSYMEQLCVVSVETMKGKEEAKKLRNDLEYDFEEWKKEAIKNFIEEYPENYKWQLEFDDWEGALKSLTDIYKERKL
tara:strand:- start:171 stop:560 length:390 start_codon:yes stop_codon:yes gene_type:complete